MSIKLVLSVAIILSSVVLAVHDPVDWKQFYERLSTKCAKDDAVCVGTIIVSALQASHEEVSSSFPHRNICSDIVCHCDDSFKLRCIVGVERDSLTIDNDDYVYVATKELCEQAIRTVKVSCSFCNNSSFLYEVKLRTLQFKKGEYLSSPEKCKTVAETPIPSVR